MHHFLYKSYLPSGLFYIGRHSTENLEDGYQGSGKWIRLLKNKNDLKTEILSYHSSYNELILAEEKLINEVIDDKLNMNFNNNSVGFATGDLNYGRTPEGRLYRSENNWMKTEKGKRWAHEHNPSKLDSVKILRAKKTKEQLSNGTHNFQNPDVRKKVIEAGSKRWKENNPAKTEEGRLAIIQRESKRFLDGTHNFQNPLTIEKNREMNRQRWTTNNPMKDPSIAALYKKPKEKVQCPHCAKIGGKPVMIRYHFDNCKITK